ncbi:MAG TPA: AraC family transcriptional regulator [Polyangiaceae bacterium]|jgi:AraC-like DNA-binding protein|nr:AraC family transcriptional regulator [Polyangiaceae bacterium]
MAKALEARGFDAAPLFARAGLDFAALDDPEARFPVRTTALLWRLAVEATGDPCFGLEVARHTSPTTFHALGFSLAASSSVHEAFERVVRYYRLVSDAASIRFEEHGAVYRVSARSSPLAHPSIEAIDALFAVAIRLCRSLTDRGFAPLAVELRRPAPPDPTPFYRCFRSPVTFDASEDAMTLPKARCDERIQGANPELARANDRIAAEALARWESSHLADRVRVVLLDGLPNGAQSQAEVARQLGLSTRALQRRLAAESTSYGALVDGTRRELALAYLREARHSMTDIGYLLGFSGAASFTRAFRRWTGKTPSEYQRRR